MLCIFPGGKAGNVVNGISKGSCHLYPELIYEQWPGSRNKRFSGPGGDAEERGGEQEEEGDSTDVLICFRLEIFY